MRIGTLLGLAGSVCVYCVEMVDFVMFQFLISLDFDLIFDLAFIWNSFGIRLAMLYHV